MDSRKEDSVGQAWFYHAAPKNEGRARVGYPVLSQIPGLNREAPENAELESKQCWIRDCDSAYVRLARQGGRPDLLNMQPKRSPKPPTVNSMYKRCDWYYHDLNDNSSNAQASQPCPDTAEEKAKGNQNDNPLPGGDSLKLD